MDSTKAAPAVRETKLYFKRWWIMTIFVLFSASNSFQWAQYTVVEGVIADYYQIKPQWVEWTSLSYSLNVSTFIIPWAWLLEKYGFRKVIMLASWFNAVGATLKAFSGERSSFPIAFVGQWFVALGQLGYLPARLAALWFGPDEVSTACSLGVIGNQFGVAVGFIVPPLIIKMNEDKEVTKSQICLINYLVAGSCIVILILMHFCLDDRPKLPPSRAALEQRKEKFDFGGTLKRLSKNKGYILLLLVFGANMGAFCGIATLLNRIVLTYFPEASVDVGWIGLITIVTGIVGSYAGGMVLDKLGHYKEVSVAICVSSALSTLALTLVIDKGHIVLVYITTGLIGFFMTSYFTVGLELGAELTYPENEGTAAGIVNGIPQCFSVISTMFGSWLIQTRGVIACCYFFTVFMAAGAMLSLLIPKNYRRRAMRTEQALERGNLKEMEPLQKTENTAKIENINGKDEV